MPGYFDPGAGGGLTRSQEDQQPQSYGPNGEEIGTDGQALIKNLEGKGGKGLGLYQDHQTDCGDPNG